jgi:hypothetical protein
MSMAPMRNGQGDGLLEDRTQRQMRLTARPKPGVTLESASAEVQACARRLAEASPRTSGGFHARPMAAWKAHFGVRTVLFVALAESGGDLLRPVTSRRRKHIQPAACASHYTRCPRFADLASAKTTAQLLFRAPCICRTHGAPGDPHEPHGLKSLTAQDREALRSFPNAKVRRPACAGSFVRP